MELKRIDNENDLWYAERLYIDSFPPGERRDTSDWLCLTHTEPAFYNNVLVHGTVNVGFITYWDLSDFVYVEHFAVDGAVRGHGFGGMAIDLLLSRIEKPVVLEVEPPVGAMERKRINFYERHGFRLCARKYMQPAYGEGKERLELKIMYNGIDDIDERFDDIVGSIYSKVYNAHYTPQS